MAIEFIKQSADGVLKIDEASLQVSMGLPRQENVVMADELFRIHGSEIGPEKPEDAYVVPSASEFRARKEFNGHLDTYREVLDDKDFEAFIAIDEEIRVDIIWGAYLNKVGDPTERQERELAAYCDWFHGSEDLRSVAKEFHVSLSRLKELINKMPRYVLEAAESEIEKERETAAPSDAVSEPKRNIGSRVIGNIIYVDF